MLFSLALVTMWSWSTSRNFYQMNLDFKLSKWGLGAELCKIGRQPVFTSCQSDAEAGGVWVFLRLLPKGGKGARYMPWQNTSNLHSQHIVASHARLAEPLDQLQSERVDELGQSLAVGEVGKGFRRKTSVEVSVPFWHLGYFNSSIAPEWQGQSMTLQLSDDQPKLLGCTLASCLLFQKLGKSLNSALGLFGTS